MTTHNAYDRIADKFIDADEAVQSLPYLKQEKERRSPFRQNLPKEPPATKSPKPIEPSIGEALGGANVFSKPVSANELKRRVDKLPKELQQQAYEAYYDLQPPPREGMRFQKPFGPQTDLMQPFATKGLGAVGAGIAAGVGAAEVAVSKVPGFNRGAAKESAKAYEQSRGEGRSVISSLAAAGVPELERYANITATGAGVLTLLAQKGILATTQQEVEKKYGEYRNQGLPVMESARRAYEDSKLPWGVAGGLEAVADPLNLIFAGAVVGKVAGRAALAAEQAGKTVPEKVLAEYPDLAKVAKPVQVAARPVSPVAKTMPELTNSEISELSNLRRLQPQGDLSFAEAVGQRLGVPEDIRVDIALLQEDRKWRKTLTTLGAEVEISTTGERGFIKSTVPDSLLTSDPETRILVNVKKGVTFEGKWFRPTQLGLPGEGAAARTGAKAVPEASVGRLVPEAEIGQVPKVIPATKVTVNVADELARQRQILVSGSAIDKAFARQSIQDLEQVQQAGRTVFQMPQPPPAGMKIVTRGNETWYAAKELQGQNLLNAIESAETSIKPVPAAAKEVGAVGKKTSEAGFAGVTRGQTETPLRYTVDAEGFLHAPSGTMLTAIENMGGDVTKIQDAAQRILQAPSFPRIRQAALSLYRSLGNDPAQIAQRMAELDEAPWRYLTLHGGVMNAKSSRAITLRDLSQKIFQETKLPQKLEGKFRGEAGVDFAKMPSPTTLPTEAARQAQIAKAVPEGDRLSALQGRLKELQANLKGVQAAKGADTAAARKAAAELGFAFEPKAKAVQRIRREIAKTQAAIKQISEEPTTKVPAAVAPEAITPKAEATVEGIAFQEDRLRQLATQAGEDVGVTEGLIKSWSDYPINRRFDLLENAGNKWQLELRRASKLASATEAAGAGKPPVGEALPKLINKTTIERPARVTLSIRETKREGGGFLVSGRDTKNRQVRVFASTLDEAKMIRENITQGREATVFTEAEAAERVLRRAERKYRAAMKTGESGKTERAKLELEQAQSRSAQAASVPPNPPVGPPPTIMPDGTNVPPPGFETARNKLVSMLRNSVRQTNKEMEVLRAQVRKQKAAIIRSQRERALAAGESPLPGIRGAQKGTLPELKLPEGERLTSDEVKVLRHRIYTQLGPDLAETSANIEQALTNLAFEGKLPTNSEMLWMEEIFGPELVESLRAFRTKGQKALEVSLEAWNLPRSILASFDDSMVLRQGLHLLPEGAPAAKALKAHIKAITRSGADEINRTIKENPWFNHGRAHGLDLTLPSLAKGIGGREEPFFGAGLARRIPILGKGVEISERVATAYLNKLRMETYAAHAQELQRMGANFSAFKELADNINILSGRASLGRAQALAPYLNGMFFSARLNWARMQMPFRILRQAPNLNTPEGRHLARMLARDVYGMWAAIGGMVGLASAAGLAVVELDPRSSDFGKMQIGSVRVDPWAGQQQFAGLIAKLITAERKTTVTRQTIPADSMDTLSRFIESKFHPALSQLLTFQRGENFVGEKLTVRSYAKQWLPLFVQDIQEIVDGTTPGMASVLGIAAFFGMSVYNIPEVPQSIIREWQDQIDAYNAIPADRLNLAPGQMSRDRYRKKNPEAEAALFLSGQVTSLNTLAAVRAVKRVIEEHRINPDIISGIIERKERRQKAATTGQRLERNLVDTLIRELEAGKGAQSLPPTPFRQNLPTLPLDHTNKLQPKSSPVERWSAVRGRLNSTLLAALANVWYGGGKLSPQEEQKLRAVHSENSFEQPDFNIWLKQTLRQIHENSSMAAFQEPTRELVPVGI